MRKSLREGLRFSVGREGTSGTPVLRRARDFIRTIISFPRTARIGIREHAGANQHLKNSRGQQVGLRPRYGPHCAQAVQRFRITPRTQKSEFAPLRAVAGNDILSPVSMNWGSSSVGRASRSQRGGREFESLLLHHFGRRQKRLSPVTMTARRDFFYGIIYVHAPFGESEAHNTRKEKR